MRIVSELFVSALVRRVFSDGGFAAVTRRGATEAGAIFLIVRDRLGTLALYGPAPQTSYDEEGAGERRFSLLADDIGDAEITSRLDREMRFDRDVWVVEIEPARLSVGELISIVE